MIELKKIKDGLEIILTDKKDFLYEFEDRLDTMSVSELLDASGYLGNGWDDVTNHIGLTEAPAIAFMADINPNGEYFDWEDMWYFSNYMLENPFETLLIEGRVVFTKAN
jgi:hypothetical protein